MPGGRLRSSGGVLERAVAVPGGVGPAAHPVYAAHARGRGKETRAAGTTASRGLAEGGLSSRERPEIEKLRQVNDFFNRIPFVSDAEHWRVNDYWATPTEMLMTNGGDCEDYAIAKYFTLLMLGVPMEKLKITYVKARNPQWTPPSQAHMVLTYYADNKAIPLVLDNLIPEIRPASQRSDLTPVYAFNGAGLWLAQQRGLGKTVEGGSNNIGFWRDLIARMGKEFD